MMNELFAIIKPDALVNRTIRQYIYDELLKFDVKIENMEKKFTTSEIDQLWPGMNESSVLNGLLKCYLTLQKSEIVFLYGNITFEQLYFLKQKVRKKYSKGKFANCIHTPQNIYEFSMQYKVLISAGNSTHNDCIDKMAINIWNILRIYGWKYSYARGVKEKYRIYMVNDDCNKIDFVAETFFRVMNIYSMEICYILVLQTEFYGERILFGCDSMRKLKSIENALKSNNISAYIENIV